MQNVLGNMFDKRFPDGFLELHKGKTFQSDGETWTLDSWNDLNIPYFRKGTGKKIFWNKNVELMLDDLIED